MEREDEPSPRAMHHVPREDRLSVLLEEKQIRLTVSRETFKFKEDGPGVNDTLTTLA